MRFIQEFPAPVDEELTAWKWFSAQRQMRKKDTLIYEDARFVIMDLPMRADAAKRILPWMLRPADPAMGTLIVADYPKIAGIAPYREALLLVHVKSWFGVGVLCAWIVVDDDSALIYGREFAGYPKKWADIEYSQDEGGVSARVSRRGTDVIELTATRKGQALPGPVFARRHFNVGGFGQCPWFLPIWCFKPQEIIKKSYEAQVELTVNRSHHDPLFMLFEDLPETVPGRIVETDIRGVKYFLFAGLAGFFFFLKTFNLRYR